MNGFPTGSDAHSTHQRATWAGVGIAFLCTRILVFTFAPANPDFNEFGVIADHVLDGRGYVYSVIDGVPVPSSRMPPGYVGLVLVAKWLGQHAIGPTFWIRLINFFLQIIGLVLAGLIARKLWPHSGWLPPAFGAVAYAVVPTFAFAVWLPSSANAYLVLGLAAVLLASRTYVEGGQDHAKYAALGCILGFLWLFRAETPLFAAVLLAGAAIAGIRHAGLSRALALTGASLGAMAIIGLPWIVRNSVAHGEVVYTMTSTMGFNLYVGNSNGASGSQMEWDLPDRLRSEEERLPPTPDYELRQDDIYLQRLMDEIAASPNQVPRQMIKKAAMLVTYDPHDARTHPIGQTGMFWILLIAGAASLRSAWKHAGAPAVGAIVIYIATTTATIVAVFFLTRYRVGIELILAISAGACLGAKFNSGTWSPPGER